MRPEIFYTFERNSVPKYDKPERIGLGEIKEALNTVAKLAMEVIKSTYEVAEKDGLKAAGRELKSLKDWRMNVLTR